SQIRRSSAMKASAAEPAALQAVRNESGEPVTAPPAEPATGAEQKDMSKLVLPPPVARRRWLWVGVAFLILVVGSLLTLALWSRGRGASQPQYVSMEARRGDLEATVTATGRLEALDQVEVGAEISGRIIEVNVDFNDRVEQDQVLAKLDSEQ